MTEYTIKYRPFAPIETFVIEAESLEEAWDRFYEVVYDENGIRVADEWMEDEEEDTD